MHELAITQSIVDLVCERTTGRRVTGVVVRVGAFSGVVADALRFAWDVATQATPLAGATLVLDEVPGRIHCRDCGAESTPLDLIPLCACGSADVAVVSGQELSVVSVELVAEPSCV